MLQVEFVFSSTLENDVIRFPCLAPSDVPEAGCNRSNPGPITFRTPACDSSVFDACNSPSDLCSDLEVTIFCTTVGRKAYRFRYVTNPATSRYETLLGFLGYEYLLLRGGDLSEIRIINVTVYDSLSEMVNPLALTRIRVQNQDVLIITVDPPPPAATFIVYEDERPGRTCNLYTLQVQHLDGTIPGPGEVVYNITGGNIGNAFGINEEGTIFLNSEVDREMIPQYTLVVSARIRDADVDTTASAVLIAEVIDVNDNYPITAESYSVNVSEGVTGAEVVRVIATDADEGTNAELTYLLLGIGAENFRVDNDGVVRTTIALNRSIDDYYLLVMIITDRGEIFLSTHTVINVYVITPPPSDLAFNPIVNPMVLESTPVNSVVSNVSAFEVGGDGDTRFIRYRFGDIISSTTGMVENPEPFRVNEVSGVITVNAVLDAERSEEYQAVIEAYSVRTLFPPRSAFANITFQILDSNELPPMFIDAPYTISVAENTATGTTVSTIRATDSDSMNQGLIYSLGTSVPAGLPFTVAPNGGIIVSDTIDYETDTTFTFTVAVRDNPANSMPSMSATAQVTVNVLDRNDNAPQFVGTPYNVSVRETEPDGYVVLEFNTTDADSNVNSIVSYTAEGLDGTPFCLVDRTIQVCNASQLTSIEDETATVFMLRLVATNPPGAGSTVQQVTREMVEIEVILINEFDPEPENSNIILTGYLEEHCGTGFGNSCIGIMVYDFGSTTIDEDGGGSGDLTFTLLTLGVPFSLSESGILTISGRIDREVTDLYTLQVLVSDMGDIDGSVRSSLVNITIPILDIDDNRPFYIPPFEFNVTEAMTENRQVFGQIMFTDSDIDDTYEFYFLASMDPPIGVGCYTGFGSNYLPIEINPNTGELFFCESIDFESGPNTFEIRVLLRDFGILNGGDRALRYIVDRTFTVNVVDSNDNPPVFVQDTYNFVTNENMAAQSLVGSIRAMDSDAGPNADLTFSIINGSTILDCNDEIPFYIEKTSADTAAVITCQPLDYEATLLYTFTVRVCDGATVPLCDDAIVTVMVRDRNDNPPQFVPAVYSAMINETDSSDMMSNVVTVQVTDADSPPNSISSFSILTPNSPFGLRATPNSNEAIVYVVDTDAIDFENGTIVYVIEVQALNLPADAGDTTQSSTTTVTVTIVDVNDNAPMIMPPFEFSVRENQPAETQVGCVDAIDIDSEERGNLVYYIGSIGAGGECTLGDLFAINSIDGCISTCDSLDYESDTSHSFMVVVCDSSDPPMCSNMTFTVNVLDLNDNAPIYDEDPFIIDINEGSTMGTRVITISSSDVDSAPNSGVVYSFQNTSGPFDIRSVTGEVIYNGADELDFEGPTRTYIIHVQGLNAPFFPDDVIQRSDVALVINVVDRNDEAPTFPQPSDTVSIPEHSPVSTEVYTLSTTDGDSLPNSVVRYEIVESGSPFAIQGNVVVVTNSDAIDYDPPASVRDYVLTIRAINEPAAIDDITQISEFTLTITVTDINDNAPECVGRDVFILPEDAELSFSLVRVMANDIDDGFNGNAGLQFFVTGDDSGSGSGFGSGDPLCSEQLPFRIDPDSGYISICVPLDYETTNAYEVNITVCDMGFPRLCTVCPIMFSVMDVNDNAPIILPPLDFAVSEEQSVGYEIGCINATDADSGQNADIVYFLLANCSIELPFNINETTGCIDICSPLDFEITTNYSFNVIATDNGSPKLLDSDVVTVNVINENDHAPVFTSSNFAEVEEESGGELVIVVMAVDVDAPPFNTFTFELEDDADGSFVIDPITGEVRTTFPLDRETRSTYSIIVRVFDGLNENRQTIFVVLLDINDNPPEYLGDLTYRFMENMLFELQLVFRDNDTGNNSVLNYEVSDSQNQFSIDSSGVLRNLMPLDRDPATNGTPTIMPLVTVSDSGEFPFLISTVITIELIDVNDNAPVALRPFMADVVDGSPAGTEIFTVSASDADEGVNAELVFELGQTSDRFAINFTTGTVSLTRPVFLMSDSAERLALTVNISDRGLPTQVTSQQYQVIIVSALPQFTEASYSFSANENEFSVVIGTVDAEDRDLNPFNDVFVFAIESVSPYNPGFTIRSNGTLGTLLSPADYFDYEDATYFNISVTVSQVNMTEVIDDRAYAIINLVDSNDNIPRLSPLNISAELREDARDGEIVATAIAIDFDMGPGGQLMYNLSGSGAENFAFDSNGNLYINMSGAIDFEADMSYVFVYQACDGGIPQLCSDPGYIFIEVINIDDLPPVFDPSSYDIMISEGFGTNLFIVYVNFSDPDTPLEDITLTLQPPQVHFQIVLLSGVGALMTTDVPLDREILGVHTFSIVATDTAGATASASVQIILVDENDERPFVDTGDTVVTFGEGGPPVFPADGLNIVDEDDVSLFPLINVSVSLRPDPTSTQVYPSPGGICDHANYSLLFNNNVHNLCGLSGCIYLLSADEIVFPLQGSQIGGILELPRQQDIARNPVVLLNGDQFDTFTVTIWVRFTARDAGNIFEAQSGSFNVFGVSVNTDGSLRVFVNPTSTTTEFILVTGPLSTQDGQWHQLALKKEGRNLTMFFDCEIAQESVIDSSIDTAFTRGDFRSASFFLGNRLAGGFYAEFYFCSSVASQSHICCTLNCGESLNVASPTDDVETIVDFRTRSVEFTYTGSINNASLTQLQEALQKITYNNVLDEPHPLDRGLAFTVYDMIGQSDVQSVVILRPVLINDQRPVIDLNGLAQPGVGFSTRFDETSAGTSIIGPDTILYDLDSGYWPIGRIIVELVGSAHTLEFLDVVPGLTPLTINILNSGSRVEIFSGDPRMEYFPSDFINALNLVRYVDRTEEPSEFTRSISITVFDQNSTFVNDPLSFTDVTITPSNDMPVLDLNTADPATQNTNVIYEERAGRVLLLQGTTQSITDPDSTSATGATFVFTQRPNGEQEVLQINVASLPPAAASTLVYSFDLAAGRLSLSGNYDFNTWLGIFRAVEYANNELNPSELDMHEIAVTIRDDGGVESRPAFIRITLSLFNNPPQIFLGGGNIMDYSTTFIEDGDCIPVTSPNVSLVDLDSPGIRLVRISLTNTPEERLVITGPQPDNNVIFPINPGTIILVLQRPADYEDVLRRLVYCNTADEPDESSVRQISFQATDTGLTTASGTLGSSTSNPSITTIQIIRVNDQPELSFEPLNNISIRGVPTQIIDPQTIVVEDSDDDFFNELLIFITNPQDGAFNEIIEFARQLPESTVSVGPLVGMNGEIFYRVTFRDSGGDVSRVNETISNVRYNNRANRITVDPPRVICLTIRDFQNASSERECVTVTISPPNNFDPVFNPTSTSLTFFETDNPISVASLTATDGDTGLEGTISFSISQILSYNLGGAQLTTSSGIISIVSDGVITAPNGLDAEQYNRHDITVVAADMGNPVRSAELELRVDVADLNDVAPTFRGVPYIAGSQREELSPPRFVFLVTAVDLDVTSPNNAIQRYGLENYQDLFSIDSFGSITSIAALDAEIQPQYILNVSAVDSGIPPQTGYTTVLFNLIDFNDNAAEIAQLAPAIYVIGGSPSSIGPAIRIEDDDLNLPAINQFSVTLTPNAMDASRTYDQCLVQCQETRIREAGLLPPAIDMLALATFQQDQPETNGQVNFRQTQVGAAGCNAWELTRGTISENDGYGRIPRGNLPDDFASGDFTISFVLAQTSEGYIIVVPDQTNPNLPTTSVGRSFAIWLRRNDFRFYYTYNGISNDGNPAILRLNQESLFEEFFNPNAAPQTRHYTVIVRSSPAIVEIYVDCQFLGMLQLDGPVQSPLPNVDVFIGHSRPRPTNGGRLAGTISNFFYHPTAITPTQLLNFCSCGFEAIYLPPLPSSIVTATEEETRLVLEPSSGLIPVNDALSVLRGITYENTFPSPTVSPDRELQFTVREETGMQGTTVGSVKLVASDDNLPVIDLTGTSLAGIDYVTTFTEDASPVLVAPNIRISRNIEDSVRPTFDRVMVRLMNPIDSNEILTATSSSSYITVEISSNGQTVLITGPGIEPDFVAVLQTVAYENTNDNPTVSPNRVISFTVVDTEGRVSNPVANTRVMLTAVNDPPQVSMGSILGDVIDTVEFMEGSSGVLIAPNAIVMDVDNTELLSATVRLQSPNMPADALVYNNLSTPAISGDYNPMTGVLQLTGRAPLADYETVLSSVMFTSSDSPLLGSDGNPVVDPTRVVMVVVSDGELDSQMAQVTVQFIPINDPPVVTINSTTVEFRDGDREVLIAPTIDIIDVDTQLLFSLEINLQGTVDEHQLSDGVRVSRTLVFGNNTSEGFTSILRGITYINFAPEPMLVPRFIDIEVCDSDFSCTQVQITVLIIDTNDNPPVFTAPEYTLPVTEDVPIGFTIGSLIVNDRDQMTLPLTFSMDGSDPFELNPDGSTVHVVTTQLLDFEITNIYMFMITASDGVNLGFTNVTVDVQDVNEQPVIVLDPPAPSIVVGPGSESQLILVNIQVSDPDFGDNVDRAQLVLDNVPDGSNETLGWNEISGYSFVQASDNVFELTRLTSSVPLAEALQSINYVAGLIVTDLTEIRRVAVTVYDLAGLSSEEAAVNVSLASIPRFTAEVYTVSLMEEVIRRDFLQVEASVENGGDVIEYSIDSGSGVTIDPVTGLLSLVRPLNHEVERLLTLSVFAVDALPPARTGTATVNITVVDVNDVRPAIGGTNNVTISTGVAIDPFSSITISDPDTVGQILNANVAIVGNPLAPSPFSGRVCADEYNVINKMTDVCGLPTGSFIDLAANIGSLQNVGIMTDSFLNRILNNFPNAGYSAISADFRPFQGPISEFTFTIWLAPSTSGYIAYFGTPDATERYFAVYYDDSDNQITVTLKRSGLSGLSAQVRVNFQLQSTLSDGNFHFIMIQYVQRNLVCVVDGTPVGSLAVVYKEQPFIGEVYGKQSSIIIVHS